MPAKGAILCIDEHEVLLRTLVALLSRFGYTPLAARTLDEAVAIASTHPLDAVLLDYHLCPGCPSGAQPCLADRLRALQPQAKVLVWCVDGSCLKDPPACASAAFMKPIDPTQLIAKIESVLAN